jgi:hypothetical protein
MFFSWGEEEDSRWDSRNFIKWRRTQSCFLSEDSEREYFYCSFFLSVTNVPSPFGEVIVFG